MEMLIKLGVFLSLLLIIGAQLENQQWDIAVVINNEIKLFNANRTIFNHTFEDLNQFKAITYDINRHQFIVSEETSGTKDTIYALQVSKETDIVPIVPDLPDDVQGLSIDPQDNILYWTEIQKKTISFVSLNTKKRIPKVLWKFEDQIPQDVAVDHCSRYLFWTNSNSTNATIERSNLKGTEKKTIVIEGLYKPLGLTIDHTTKRIYWIDKSASIYYRIESCDFDGGNRKVLCEDTHQKPFALAVDKDYVYWSDTIGESIWRIHKSHPDKPEVFLQLQQKPMGLVARNLGFSGVPDCNKIITVEKLPEIENREYTQTENISKCNECFNGGRIRLADCKCLCPRGFSGERCEIDLCQNYCNEGECVRKIGGPQCVCPKGLSGRRCEKNICDNFCLNGGTCSVNINSTWGAKCECRTGFVGSRCEINAIYLEVLCAKLCISNDNANFLNNFNCRCDEEFLASKYNLTNIDTQGFLTFVQNPYVLYGVMAAMICVIIGLVFRIYKLKHTRPRIKKRIVVNKNVTPLTYRPQLPTEHCEITIENCCNMNVCETPCFEPPAKKDEKKNLLANMEQNEDLY